MTSPEATVYPEWTEFHGAVSLPRIGSSRGGPGGASGGAVRSWAGAVSWRRNGHAGGGERPPTYSALTLLRHGLAHEDWPRVWRSRRSRASTTTSSSSAPACTAWPRRTTWRASHGIRRVAVLDKGYVGGGGSGRNTAILRSNYLTPEGVRFYDRSVQLYRTLAADLNFNVMFARRGHLTLAHNDGSLRTMRWRAEVNKLQGVDSEVIDPEEIKAARARSWTSRRDTRYPILGALYHPPGGHHPARRRQLGLRPGGGRSRRPDPPEHRGRSAVHTEAGRVTGRLDEQGRHLGARSSSTAPLDGRASMRRDGGRAASRSSPTRCRPPSPSR